MSNRFKKLYQSFHLFLWQGFEVDNVLALQISILLEKREDWLDILFFRYIRRFKRSDIFVSIWRNVWHCVSEIQMFIGIYVKPT